VVFMVRGLERHGASYGGGGPFYGGILP